MNWSFVWGQIVGDKQEVDTTTTFYDCCCKQEASYEGGINTLYKELKNNLKYPKKVKKVKGETYLIFTVSKTGKIINPKIEKSLGQEYNNMILKALEQTNQNWASARDNRGKSMNQEKRIKITFKKRKFKII